MFYESDEYIEERSWGRIKRKLVLENDDERSICDFGMAMTYVLTEECGYDSDELEQEWFDYSCPNGTPDLEGAKDWFDLHSREVLECLSGLDKTVWNIFDYIEEEEERDEEDCSGDDFYASALFPIDENKKRKVREDYEDDAESYKKDKDHMERQLSNAHWSLRTVRQNNLNKKAKDFTTEEGVFECANVQIEYSFKPDHQYSGNKDVLGDKMELILTGDYGFSRHVILYIGKDGIKESEVCAAIIQSKEIWGRQNKEELYEFIKELPKAIEKFTKELNDKTKDFLKMADEENKKADDRAAKLKKAYNNRYDKKDMAGRRDKLSKDFTKERFKVGTLIGDGWEVKEIDEENGICKVVSPKGAIRKLDLEKAKSAYKNDMFTDEFGMDMGKYKESKKFDSLKNLLEVHGFDANKTCKKYNLDPERRISEESFKRNLPKFFK